MGHFGSALISQAAPGASLGGALGDEGLAISVSGSAAAAGDNASASISLVASVGSHGSQMVAEAAITAEAEASDGGDASVSATTDAEAFGAGIVVTKEQVETDIDGESPSALSFTYLRAVRGDFGEFGTRDFLDDGILSDWLGAFDWWT